jgi:hypothetical protein
MVISKAYHSQTKKLKGIEEIPKTAREKFQVN